MSNILSLKRLALHFHGKNQILGNNNSLQEPAVSILSPNSKFRERMQNLYFRLLTVIYKLPP